MKRRDIARLMQLVLNCVLSSRMVIVGVEAPVNSAIALGHLRRETRVREPVEEGEADLAASGCQEERALLSNKAIVVEEVAVDTFMWVQEEEEEEAVAPMAEDLEVEAEAVDMVTVLEAADMAAGTPVEDLVAAIKVDTVADIQAGAEVEVVVMEEVIPAEEECALLFKRECATEEVTVDFVTKAAAGDIPAEEVKVEHDQQEYVLISKKVYVIEATPVDIVMRVGSSQTVETRPAMTKTV